jgi:hypothetical protein
VSGFRLLDRVDLEGRIAPALTQILEGDRRLLAPLGWAPTGDRPPAAPPGRRRVAEALAASNERLGHPDPERALALADPMTVAVVAGQQPGLAGGPFLTLLKALGVLGWVDRLAEEGRAAVPLFWVASQDHDRIEIDRVGLPTGVWTPPLNPHLAPVGPQRLGPLGRRAFSALVDAAGGGDLAFLQVLEHALDSVHTHTESFASIFFDLLGEDAPVLVDPMDPILAEEALPALDRLVVEADTLEARSVARSETLRASGAGPRIDVVEGEALLFLHVDGDRRRLCRTRGGWRPRGLEEVLSDGEVRKRLRDGPTAFSPTALGRPLVQEELLGPTLYVAGPSELVYWLQLAPLWARTPPVVTLRPRAAVLDAADIEALAHFRLTPRDAVEEGLRALHESGLDPAFRRLRRRIEEAFEAQGEALGDRDGWDKTRGSVMHNLERFGAKLRRASRRADPEAFRRAEQAVARLRPGGKLQDQALCTAWMRLHFGPDLVPSLRATLDLDPRRLQVVGGD